MSDILSIQEIKDTTQNARVFNEVVTSLQLETILEATDNKKKLTLTGYDKLVKTRLQQQLITYGGMNPTGPYQPETSPGVGGYEYKVNDLFEEDSVIYLVTSDFTSTTFVNDQTLNVFTVQQGLSTITGVRKVKSVFDPVFATLQEGDVVDLTSYHDGWAVMVPFIGPSGGGSGVLAFTVHNGGTAISRDRTRPTWGVPEEEDAWFTDSGVIELCLVRQHPEKATVEMFGAKGDSGSRTQDDTRAIQKCYETVRDINGYLALNSSIGSGANTGARDISIFGSSKVYCLSKTLNFSTNYDNIEFNECLFLPHTSFNLVNPANPAFNFTLYNAKVKNLRLGMFKLGFTASNTNLNIGKVEFNGLQASNVDKLCELTLRSTITTFNDYRLDKVRIAAEVLDGDKVIFEDGWFSAGTFTSEGGAHFIMNSPNSAGLELNKMVYVPTPQTVALKSIVRMSTISRVTIDSSLCGGEPGQIPLVANYAPAQSGLTRGTHITINNTSGFTTGNQAAVELFRLPNSVVFNDYYGAIEESHAYGLVYFREDVQTWDAAETELGTKDFGIHIKGRVPSNYLGWPNSMTKKLMKYDRSPIYTERDRANDVTNTVGHVIVPKNRAGRSRSLIVTLMNDGNGAGDRCSKYYACSTDGASGLATWSITPIEPEGTSTAAGRLIVNGAGDLEVRCNSVAVNSFVVTMEYYLHIDPF